MAKCPNSACDREYFWDNSFVAYRDKKFGNPCRELELLNKQTEKEDGIIVTMMTCNKCGVILGFYANDPIWGGPVFNHPDWEGVDWDDPHHNEKESE